MCQACGKEFLCQESRARKGRGKYCSVGCCLAATKAKPKKIVELRPLVGLCKAARTGRTVECETCSKPFYVPRAVLGYGFGRFCSRNCFGAAKAKLAPANAYSRGKGGRRADLNNMYFRSRWEANYARYLNFLKEHGAIENWEYEPDTFEFTRVKRGSRFYTPDFKVFAKDGTYRYEEVKGWLTPKGRTKLKRMLLYFPNEKLVLVDQPVYRAVAKQVSALLPHWEISPKKGRY